MDLIVALQMVDRVTGERQAQQLAAGWMGRESRIGRRLRGLGASALHILAARLAPPSPPAPVSDATSLRPPMS